MTTQSFVDAAEALWGVVANASGGDWTRESVEWQTAAARARDLYHTALASRSVEIPSEKCQCEHPKDRHANGRGGPVCLACHEERPQDARWLHAFGMYVLERRAVESKHDNARWHDGHVRDCARQATLRNRAFSQTDNTKE